MSSVHELNSSPQLENGMQRNQRTSHSGSQPQILVGKQAATIQPAGQIGSLLASTKRSRDEGAVTQAVQNLANRSLYHKSQSRDRQHGSQEAIVSRKLRKDSRSTNKPSIGPVRYKSSNAGLVGDA